MGQKMRTWMCAHRRFREKKTQDRISGNVAKWAGGQVGKTTGMAFRTMDKTKTRSPKERAQNTRKQLHNFVNYLDFIW